jgi:hypothetical protein
LGKSSVAEPLRDVLADGIVFADPQEDRRADPLAPVPLAPVATTNSPVDDENASGERWTMLVRFYANGRSLNARLKLRVSKSWSIEILLRGLTGTLLVGEPQREETDPETSPRESWSPSRISDSR